VSAVLTAQEPSAKYLVNLQPPLVRHFDLIAQAPGGVAHLRELILTLAVQGKLVPQDASDEPASELLKKIRVEKDRLIAEGKIKRDKPLVEIADEEKPFELPQGWEWVRLGEISDFTNGFAFPSNEFSSDAAGIGIIKIGDIQNGLVTTASMSYVSRQYAKSIDDSFRVVPGDMLIAMSGATTGKLGFNRHEISFLLNQRVGKISFRLVNQEFACHYLTTKIAENLSISAGSAIPNLSTAQIKEIAFPLAPLAEQFRIVTRVEQLMQLCDALQGSGQLVAQQHAQLVNTLLGTLTQSETPEALNEAWQRIATHFDVLLDRPSSVDAFEQTILQLAVRGLLVPQDPTDEPASVLLQKIRTEKDHLIAQGKIKRDKPLPAITDEEKPFELPQGWEWARLGSLGVTQTGGTPASSKPEYFNGNVPFIGPGQITPSGQILPAEKFLSELGMFESAVVEPGDIMMVCIGGSIGKCAAATFPTAFNQQINSIQPVLSSSEYVLDAMSSIDFTQAVLNAATGSATPIISKGKWDLLLLPLPPQVEQDRIVARVNKLCSLCAGLRQRLTACQTAQAHLAVALVTI